MAKKNKEKRGYEELYIEDMLDFYGVYYADENGRSLLAKCITEGEAQKRLAHHRRRRSARLLLKPDASVECDLCYEGNCSHACHSTHEEPQKTIISLRK